MTARLVTSAWWLLVMLLIGAAAIACVLLGYSGVLSLLAQRWTAGAAALFSAALLCVACGFFCRYRTDLVD